VCLYEKCLESHSALAIRSVGLCDLQLRIHVQNNWLSLSMASLTMLFSLFSSMSLLSCSNFCSYRQ
jgi:hypothetical protein